VHRDLKPENVLVSQNESQIQIKLADFGFATSTRLSHLSKAYKGTKRGFMAPEISELLKNGEVEYDMYKTDIFALGVILFSLVTERLPF
jgi:serine/threonine protein kinase